MTTTLTFTNAGPDHDWQAILLELLQEGAYLEAEGTGKPFVTLEFNGVELLIESTGGDLAIDGDGELSGGTITGVTLTDGSDEIFTATFSHVLSYLAVQDLIDVEDLEDMLAGLDAWYGNAEVNATGSDEHDVIYGGSENDTLDGGEGNDYLIGGEGDDTLTGGDGWDDVRYEREIGMQGVIVNLGQGTIIADIGDGDVVVAASTATDTFGDIDTLSGIDFVGGTRFADYFQSETGNSNSVHFFMGGAGNDTFVGADGFDGVAYDIVAIEGGDDGVIINLSESETLDGGNSTTIIAGTARDTYGDIDTLIGLDAAAGSGHDDTILGSNSDNQLWGRGGKDLLMGADGADKIEGNDDNDTLDGGAGDDTLVGGEGNDTLDGGTDTDTLDYSSEGGTGGINVTLATNSITDTFGTTDTIANIEAIIGTGLNDTMIGAGGNDSFVGGNGNDTLVGNGGNDTLVGGEGRDFLIGGAGNDLIIAYENGGGPGPHYWGDYIMAGLGINVINATAVVNTDGFVDGHDLSFIDILTQVTVDIGEGTASADGMSTTFDHVHFVMGGGAADSLTGGGDSDFEGFVGNGGNDTINGDGGWDAVDYREEVEVGHLNASGSNVKGTLGVIVNLLGNTAKDSYGNTDTLIDIDEVRGTKFNDQITGNNGDNRLEGNEGNDLLRGLNGNNDYDGGAGDDTIEGGNDEDWMRGGLGNDIFRGGEGWNNIVYIDDDRSSGIIFDWLTGIGRGQSGEVDRFEIWSIGSVHGTNFNDILIGNAEDNTFHGYDGVDLIFGGGGTDTVHFHNERDHEDGDGGVKIVLSNRDIDGNDILADEDHTAVGSSGYFLDDLVDGATEGYTIDGFGNIDTIYSIENAEGTDFNDTISGSNERNDLRGMGGNDKIEGFGGDDNIDGGGGNDTLEGGDGSDWFEGGWGTDTITGGSGDDGIGFYRWGGDDEEDYDDDAISITLTAGFGTGIVDGTIFRDGEVRTVDTTFSGLDNADGSRGNDSIIVQSGFQTDGLGWDWRTFGDGRDPAGPFHFAGGRGNDTITDNFYRLVVNYRNESQWEDREDPEGNDPGDAHGVTINLSGAQKVAVGFDNDNVNGNDTVNSGRAVDTFGFTDTIVGVTMFNLTNYGDYFVGRDGAFSSATDQGVYLQGNDGNDYLAGGNGNDVIHGDRHNDTLLGGSGIDRLNGSQGADLIYGDDATDSHGVADGGDDLSGGSENDTIYGGGGRDNISGDDGEDKLYGGTGRDRLWGGNQKDVLDGGGDADQLEGDNGDDTIDGGTGDDEIGGGLDNDNLRGGAGNDEIDGNEGSDTLYGDDTINAGAGDGTVVGHDTIHGGNDNDTIFGGYGNDRLEGDNGLDSLDGGAGNDSLYGGNQNDTILGGAGDDRVSGNNDNDSLDGGAGNDKLWGDNGNDSLQGGLGTDDLNGGNDNDTLVASAGKDRLFGDAGNDVYQLGAIDNLDIGEVWDSSGTDRAETDIDRNLNDWGMGDTIENATIMVATNGIDLVGNELNNLLTGGGGTNSLSGGDGDDTLNGGAGNDTMEGGNGNDTFFADAAGDVTTDSGTTGSTNDIVNFTGTTGTHTIGNGIEKLNLTSTAAVNGTGNSAANTITGNAAANILNGGGGTDTLFGMGGNDTYVVDAQADVVNETGGSGVDTIQSSVTYTMVTANIIGAVENLTLIGSGNINGTGNTGHNVLTGNSGKNSLSGGDGNDTLVTSGGDDTIVGGNGTDTLSMAGFTSSYWVKLGFTGKQSGGSGLSTTFITVSGVENILDNNIGNLLAGNTGANLINAAGGNDDVYYSGGADTLIGGDGRDELTFQIQDASQAGWISSGASFAVTFSLAITTAQTVNGVALIASGFEDLSGGNANDNLTGNAGDNMLFGGYGSGSDTLNGGDGNDYLRFDGGADVMNGGNGTDAVDIGTASTNYNLNLSLTTAQAITGLGSVKLSSIENLYSGNGNDTITGSTGNNFIDARSGNDNVMGGDGNDTMDASVGSDTFDGGNGIDTFTVVNNQNFGAAQHTTLNLSLATSQTVSGAGSVKLVNVENLTSDRGNDNLTGSAAANVLSSGQMNDTLNGGLGNDTLVSGVGADKFIFNSALASNIDTLTDFEVNVDKVHLENAIFTAFGTTGALAAGAFKANTTGTATEADDRIIYDTDSGALFYDTNGNAAGGVTQFAVLTAKPVLTNADFLII